MLTNVLDTTGLPPRERVERWMETTARALLSTRLTVPEPEAFRARIETMDLGPVQLSAVSYNGLRSQRPPRLIRQCDPELYQVALITFGDQRMCQAGHQAELSPGDLMLYDSSRPFDAMVHRDQGTAGSLVLQFPRSLPPLPERTVSSLCGTALEGRRGVGRLLGNLLTETAGTHADLSPLDAIRVGHTAVDLLAAVIAHRAERESRMPPDPRRHTLFLRITAFIEDHLHDPHLKPAAIASAHCISTRYLHLLFQQQGTTVTRYVRHQRLARCRRKLAEPTARSVPIGAIAARWGFPRASDFTRAFRDAVGMTPSEYRAAHQHQAGVPGVPGPRRG
jgi:AraC-like DNA-binding protein